MNCLSKSSIKCIKDLILLLFLLSITACDENPGEFTLGKEYIEYQTSVNLIDTFTVKLSTVIMDTLNTSGGSKILLGNYSDDVFGKIICNSYFQVSNPDSFGMRDSDIYDSLTLVLRYNTYSFGDTTKSQKISVHQLTENIKLDDNSTISNITTFDYNPDPIGSIIYTPLPNNENDSLSIKIDDAIGLDLFTKLKNDSEVILDYGNFINYFHGIALLTDEAYEGSIIGFEAGEGDVELILHTSRQSSLSIIEIDYEFKLDDIDKQFNNIIHDFSSTGLKTLTEQRVALPINETGGLTFLQGGVGLATRIDFPSLSELLLYERGTILEARLEIAPFFSNLNTFDPPSELSLFECDKINRMEYYTINTQSLTSGDDTDSESLYDEESVYSFDLTSYLTDELSDSYIDPEKGLLLTLPSTTIANRFDRMIIDANSLRIKLKIYYLSY